jgi:hypothetical protein
MSTGAFFMDNFGRHFIQPSGDDWADVARVLSSSYPMTGKASNSRLQSGWAIVRPGSATLQLDLAVPVIEKSRMTRFEAFAAELASWDGQAPRIFMLFDKAPIAAQAIFVSVDKRRVRICTNAGARTEDWTTNPPKVKAAAK